MSELLIRYIRKHDSRFLDNLLCTVTPFDTCVLLTDPTIVVAMFKYNGRYVERKIRVFIDYDEDSTSFGTTMSAELRKIIAVDLQARKDRARKKKQLAIEARRLVREYMKATNEPSWVRAVEKLTAALVVSTEEIKTRRSRVKNSP